MRVIPHAKAELFTKGYTQFSDHNLPFVNSPKKKNSHSIMIKVSSMFPCIWSRQKAQTSPQF